MSNQNEKPIGASDYEIKSHITEAGDGETVSSSASKDSTGTDINLSNVTESTTEPKGKKFTDSEYDISSLPNTSDAGLTE